jgi:hypothetical protein
MSLAALAISSMITALGSDQGFLSLVSDFASAGQVRAFMVTPSRQAFAFADSDPAAGILLFPLSSFIANYYNRPEFFFR